MKKVRINKKYGEWFYEKQIDHYDNSCWVYYLHGTDANGENWLFPTVSSYTEIFDIIKSSKNDKLLYKNF